MRHLCRYTALQMLVYANTQIVKMTLTLGTNFWVSRARRDSKIRERPGPLSGTGLQASDPNLCILGKNPMTHDGKLGRPVLLVGVPVYMEMVEL